MAEQKTKEQIREEVESLVKDYNEKYQAGDFAEAIKLDGKIQELVNEYTGIARDDCFAHLKTFEDPMIAAVTQLTFNSIRTIDKKEGDEKIPVREVADVEKYIDLFKLHKAIGGIGKDEKWNYMIEKFNFLLTAQKAIDLGIDPKEVNDSYAMSEISKDINMGKTPTSNTNILKTLQAVVTAMIGEEYKATSHDVAFLKSVYSKKNRKALTVTCSNHKYMRQYMAEICHRIVLNKSYAIEFKRAKK